MDFILNPWPWYLSGPLIAFVMAILLYFGKTFGMSSSLKTICSAIGANKFSDFFKFNWKDQRWNLTIVIGAIIGGFIATQFLSNNTATDLNPATITELQQMPNEMFSMESLTSIKTIVLLIIGGLLVGFGTRYASGCTSGHAITGLSSLQKQSLIAVIGFFIGGLIMTNFILPLIFKA